MKIIIFGTGKYCQNRKEKLYDMLGKDVIVAFIDNKILPGSSDHFDGYTVNHPSDILPLTFDRIILMSSYVDEMRQQLLDMGVDNLKICTWERYEHEKSAGKIKLYVGDVPKNKRKILVLTTDLNYNGGSMASIYATKALIKKGYDTWLAAPSIDRKLLSELSLDGISVAVCLGLPYISEKELYWMREFDLILVNVFQMVECAYKINHIRPVLWWIHEPIFGYDHYLETLKDFPIYSSIDMLKDIYTVAVSEIARKKFYIHYPGMSLNLMPYGIPDDAVNVNVKKKENFVFAIIGDINRRKAQKIFVEVALKLLETNNYKVEFWLIGAYGKNSYVEELQGMICNSPEIKLLGLMNRNDLRNAFEGIDAVVCSSLEDPLPIVVTEGMMNGKVVITTDATGQASMIRDGYNGFVTKAGDIDELYQKMEWVLTHRNELQGIKRNSRETYEKYFTMDKFGDRLEQELFRAKELFDSRREGES